VKKNVSKFTHSYIYFNTDKDDGYSASYTFFYDETNETISIYNFEQTFDFDAIEDKLNRFFLNRENALKFQENDKK
jgi:hypothetical protein